MIVFVKYQAGGDAGTVDLGGDDSLDVVRDKVAAATGVHPSLQQLVYKGTMLRESDNKTVRDYGITLEEDLRLSSLPEPRTIKLRVGGLPYTTSLSTLRAAPESLLAKMFDGLEHQHGANGLMEGVPGAMSTVLVPKDPDGSFAIDRNGECFAYILDYLRSGERRTVSLPRSPELREQLAIEAEHFRLDELAAMCSAGSLIGFAAACSVSADEIVALSDAELTELLKDQKVNLVLAKRIRAQVLQERERVRLEAEAEAARLAALAEAERNLQALAADLARVECFVSDEGVRALSAAGLGVGDLVELDAAAAQRRVPDLGADDARLVGALERPPRVAPSEQALAFAHCSANVVGQGASVCAHNGDKDDLRFAVGGEALDPSAGPVFWKATLVECSCWIALGVVANTQPQSDSRYDPTSFMWASSQQVWIAGKNCKHAGWDGWQAGDVAVFKLEPHQLSVRVRRLGTQTFTMPTNGVQNLRVHVSLYQRPSRVQLTRAEAHEEY